MCCDVWVSSVSNDGKEQNSNCVEEVREVCIIDPALLVTQPETKESIRDILCGLLNDMSRGTLISVKGCKEVKYFLSRTLFKLFDFYLFYDLNGLNLKAINLFTP